MREDAQRVGGARKWAAAEPLAEDKRVVRHPTEVSAATTRIMRVTLRLARRAPEPATTGSTTHQRQRRVRAWVRPSTSTGSR